jgi:hypothetical protein
VSNDLDKFKKALDEMFDEFFNIKVSYVLRYVENLAFSRSIDDERSIHLHVWYINNAIYTLQSCVRLYQKNKSMSKVWHEYEYGRSFINTEEIAENLIVNLAKSRLMT